MNTPQFFKKWSISTKTNLVIGFLLGLMLLVIIALLNNYVGNLANQTGQQRVEQEAQVLQSQFNKAIQDTLSSTKLLASTPGLVEAVASEDADRARVIAVTNRAALNLDYANIVDINKTRVAVAPGDPEHLSVVQEDDLFTLGLLGIEITAALVADEIPPTLYLVAVVPLRDTTGALVGAVLAGRDVNDELLTEINFAREDVHPLLIYEGQVIAHDTAYTVEQQPAILLDETAIAQALNGQMVITNEVVSVENTPYAIGYVPLTINDETVAVVSILVNTTSWSGFQQQLISNLSIIFAVLTLVVIATMAVIVRRMVTAPLAKLQTVAEQMAGGNYEQPAETTAMDETGRLAQAFNTMWDAVQEREVALRQEIIERQQAELDRDRLQQEVITAQQQAIRELSSPIIPVVDMPDGSGSIIVMPLIGSIDTLRAQDIMRSLLAGIGEYRANVVILDITGVPLVDSGVAHYLTQAIQAARLKGARVIVTGISDAVAESIVDLGIDWRGFETQRDLQTGLAVALNNLGIRLGIG